MKILVAWLKALWALLCGIIADLPMAFRTMLCRLHAVLCCVIHRLCGAWKSGGGLGSLFPTGIPHIPSHAPFIPINHPAWKKPDPMIYDQYYLMSLGIAVSWQNPDIQILLGGVPVASAYDLAPATTYEIIATIWNGSTSGVISGMPVSFSYLSFGVQTKSNYIGSTSVDLGVKGSVHCPALAHMQWTTPAVPGHYCIQVAFSWIDDLNPLNNLGQENTQVVAAMSPALFSFTLGNPSPDRKPFRFEFDTYAIPAQPVCPVTAPPARKPGQVTTTVANLHSRAANPLPAGWTLVFDPPDPVVPGDAEIVINVTITPPDSFHGTQPVNIHTFSGQTLVGGVTALVTRA